MNSTDRRAAERPLICATRASALALWQTRSVVAELARHGVETTELHVSTKGDVVQDRPLAAVGGDNLFIKELETAMRERRADLAVHSCKDLASSLPPDMCIAAIGARIDPRDAFCSERFDSFENLPAGALVGTSSPRRRAQLEALRPDLRFESIRGNVDTRLRKLSEGRYDAIVLAIAGLTRLGLGSRHVAAFPVATVIPAVGQGALAIECRAQDRALAGDLARWLGDRQTTLEVEAERAFLRELRAGCQAPVGAHATFSQAKLVLQSSLLYPDGQLRRFELAGVADTAEQARAIGTTLARTTGWARESVASNASKEGPP